MPKHKPAPETSPERETHGELAPHTPEASDGPESVSSAGVNGAIVIPEGSPLAPIGREECEAIGTSVIESLSAQGELSDEQVRILGAMLLPMDPMAMGETVGEIARRAGVHRSTVWRSRTSEDFLDIARRAANAPSRWALPALATAHVSDALDGHRDSRREILQTQGLITKDGVQVQITQQSITLGEGDKWGGNVAALEGIGRSPTIQADAQVIEGPGGGALPPSPGAIVNDKGSNPDTGPESGADNE